MLDLMDSGRRALGLSAAGAFSAQVLLYSVGGGIEGRGRGGGRSGSAAGGGVWRALMPREGASAPPLLLALGRFDAQGWEEALEDARLAATGMPAEAEGDSRAHGMPDGAAGAEAAPAAPGTDLRSLYGVPLVLLPLRQADARTTGHSSACGTETGRGRPFVADGPPFLNPLLSSRLPKLLHAFASARGPVDFLRGMHAVAAAQPRAELRGARTLSADLSRFLERCADTKRSYATLLRRAAAPADAPPSLALPAPSVQLELQVRRDRSLLMISASFT